MKICFVTTGNIKDNASSKRAFGMAEPLVELGWEVHLLLENNAANKERAKLECSPAVFVHYFKKGNFYSEIKHKNKILKQIKPDFIYICAFVFRNSVKKYKSKLLIEHAEAVAGMESINLFKKITYLLLANFSVIYSNGLLCASKYLENVFNRRKKTFLSKIPILYFPYAYSPQLYFPKKREALPENIRKLTDKINFVYLGTIIRNYGIFTILEAFQITIKKRSNIRLIILGSGSTLNDAREFVIDNDLNDNVLITGYIDEKAISEYFSIADAFILPMNDTVQDWARCPSKLYMYLPFEKPVVTCKIGEPPVVLQEKGFYYKSGLADDLAKTIIALLPQINDYQPIDAALHTWEHRTEEFHYWTTKNFFTK